METTWFPAANDLEKQYTILQDVAHQIRSTYSYRPGVLNGDVYREIELLEDFSRYANYSPLIGRYFLMYQNNPKLYTSEEKPPIFHTILQQRWALMRSHGRSCSRSLTPPETSASCPSKTSFYFCSHTLYKCHTGCSERGALLHISPAELMNRMLSVAPKLPDQPA